MIRCTYLELKCDLEIFVKTKNICHRKEGEKGVTSESFANGAVVVVPDVVAVGATRPEQRPVELDQVPAAFETDKKTGSEWSREP
jgi:orotate phosphoribosyltransferase-like protein